MAAMEELPRGSLVEAYNLSDASNMNGKRGLSNGRVQDGRLGVEFPMPDGTKALRPQNLMLLREGGERAVMPQLFPSPVPVIPTNREDEPAPKRRLLAYGDSLTAGYWNRGKRFAPFAAALTECLLPQLQADIWVCGLSSMTAEEMLEEIESSKIRDGVRRIGAGLTRILREQGPFDLVLIMAGTNDLGERHTEVPEIFRRIRKLHETCHKMGVQTVALSVPPCGGVLESRTHRKRWKALNSTLLDWTNDCAALPDWTRSGDGSHSAKGVALFVDVERYVPFTEDDLHDGGELWESDTLHFSRAGSRRLGECLAPLIAPVLLQRGETQNPTPRLLT